MKIRLFAVIMLSIFSASAGADSVRFYVSPDGNDCNPGTIERPFATLQRAREALRARKAGEAATVILRGGTYYLSEPLVLTPADSGREDAPVAFTAYDGETVIVSGGQRLQLDWRPYRDGIFQADTPDDISIDQLFVNGRREHMARYPNFDPDIAVYNGFAADAVSSKRAARWRDPRGGYIHAMHGRRWGGFHYRITGKDEEGNLIYEGGWQNNRPTSMHGQHRFVENIFEELDVHREWYHDADAGVLYYYPGDDVDLDNATVEAAILPHLIEIKGELESPVRHLRFEGLTFRHAARTFMENKEPLLRSDWTIYRGGSLVFEGVEDCAVINCEFDQVGGNAIMASGYNRGIVVQGCLISDSGASGVVFVGYPDAVRNPLFGYSARHSFAELDLEPGPRSENYPRDCRVEDCLIRRVGVVEKQAAGVQISMAARITVRHCSIYETSRAGINISEGAFGGHLVEWCDVFDTVLETHDHGSFNSWGRDRFWGLRDHDRHLDKMAELALLDAVETTVIRNSRWRCDHGWDVDLDDGSSNYHIYNNLMLHGGLKLREGFFRRAENNIMVNNTLHAHVWYPDSRDVFQRNIVFRPYSIVRVQKEYLGDDIDFNVLHQPGMFEPRAATPLQAVAIGEQNSFMADARFVDPPSGDYRVQEGSPALQLGFKNFPMDRFGVQRPELKAIARTPALPEIEMVAMKELAVEREQGIWMGADVQAVAGEDYSAFGISRDAGGIYLVKVPAGSPAAAAGFEENDVVLTINDQPVKSLDDLFRLHQSAVGQPKTIGLMRKQVDMKKQLAPD